MFDSKKCDSSFEEFKNFSYSSNDSSTNSSECEGEMKSSDESEFSEDDKTSEEGEIQSEIDDVRLNLLLTYLFFGILCR